jgi:hypothetical protein
MKLVPDITWRSGDCCLWDWTNGSQFITHEYRIFKCPELITRCAVHLTFCSLVLSSQVSHCPGRWCIGHSQVFLTLQKWWIEVLVYCGWYSDLLQSERSWDWVTVGVGFSAPIQTGPRAHPACCIMQLFPGVKQPGHALTTHPHQASRLKTV